MRTTISSGVALGLSLLLAFAPLAQPVAAQQATPSATPQVATATPTTGLISGVTIAVQLTPITGSPTLTGTVTTLAGPTIVPVNSTSSCGQGATHIIQACLPGLPVVNLESQAVNAVLQQYQLPSSDQNRVLGWARNEVRAALFANLVAAFQKAPSARTTDEAAEVSVLSEIVRQKRVRGATVAQDEYNKWASNPCGYAPPIGFTYDSGTACASNLTLAYGGPNPPSRAEFQAYGAAAAYVEYQTNAVLKALSSDTAKTIRALAGLSAIATATGVAGAVGASVTVSTLTAIQPFLASTILYGSGSVTVTSLGGTAAAEAAKAAVAAESAGEVGFISVGGPVAIITLAVVAGVIQGLNVFTAAEIPSQLQGDLSAAQVYDVGSAINATDAATSTAAKQELYADFLELTIPDYPSTDTVPAPQPSDPQLLVQHNPTSSIQYTAWDGSHHAARLSGGWWVDTDANGKSSLTTGIHYLDPNGDARFASHTGHLFLTLLFGSPPSTGTTPPANPAFDVVASTLTFQDWAGNATTASFPEPAGTWILGSSQANIGGNSVAHYNSANNGFDKVDGGATVVRVGPDGQPWLVNVQGAIFRRSGGPTSYVDGTWQTMPGQASDLSIGADGSVWAIGAATDVANIGGSHIYYFDRSAENWHQVDGGAAAIAVGPDGQPWIVNKQGTIFNRSRGQTSYADGTWETVTGQATAIAAGADGSIWVVGVLQSNIGGNIIYHYNPGNPNGWDQVDGGGVAIAVGPRWSAVAGQ